MKGHGKKLVAPVVVVLLCALYYIFAAVMILKLEISPLAKVLCVAVPIALIGASVFVLVERIKEIRSGEEDDLGKY